MNPDVPPTVVAPHIPDSASSSGFPTPVLNFSPGTNGHHEPAKAQKEHTDAYYRKQVQLYAAIDPNLTFFDAAVLDRMSSWVRKPDGLMISGAEKLGNYFGMSVTSAYGALKRLEKFEYLKCHKRGRGSGIASQYLEGKMYSRDRREWIRQRLLENEEKARPQNFIRTKPKGKPRGKPRTKREKVQKSVPFEDTEKVQKLANKTYKILYPQPIEQPIHKQPQDPLWAFTAENWRAYCLELNPQRDPVDIDRTFNYAIKKGAKDGSWKHICRNCHFVYKPPKAATQAATSPKKGSSPVPRPAPRSQCESPPIPPWPALHYVKCRGWYGLGSQENWEKAGRPHHELVLESWEVREQVISELISKFNLYVEPGTTAYERAEKYCREMGISM